MCLPSVNEKILDRRMNRGVQDLLCTLNCSSSRKGSGGTESQWGCSTWNYQIKKPLQTVLPSLDPRLQDHY